MYLYEFLAEEETLPYTYYELDIEKNSDLEKNSELREKRENVNRYS